MKLGILSDTHNHRTNLEKALEVLRREAVRTLIHCGDMTGPALVPLFEGMEVHYVFGNVDPEPEAVGEGVRGIGRGSSAGKEYHASHGGRSIAAIHGDRPALLHELISSGLYDYVFHGHTHRRRDETLGRTRVINPGALGGRHVEPRSICILDLGSGQARFVTIAE